MLGRMVKGIDLRQYGTKTLGISNASRYLGFWTMPGLVFWDGGCKGIFLVWATRFIFDYSDEVQALVGLCVMMGHNWPVFLRFHGGRGIAIVYGLTLALYPPKFPLEFLVLGAASLLGRKLFKEASLGVLIGVMLLPGVSYFWGRSVPIILMMLGILILVLLKRLSGNSSITLIRNFQKSVVINRLLYDRDISSKEDWLRDKPTSY